MSTQLAPDLQRECRAMAERAQRASTALPMIRGERKNEWLRLCARLLRERSETILAANARDVAAAPEYGLTAAAIDRLRLSSKSLAQMGDALEEIAQLPDPIGEIIESSIRPNGLEVQKVRAALGVVFFIYESRPNVTVDAAALCVKSGNAVILRGGKEALHSNRALAELLREAATAVGLPVDAVQLVGTTDRAAVGALLKMNDLISLTIPRGGEGLIRRVVDEATMPVMKHFAGNCHVYVDAAADLEMAEQVTVNAKCQRLGVCNAAESLLVHRAVAERFLPRIGQALQAHGIEIRGDEATQALIPGANRATAEDYATEFLGPVISVAVVDSLDGALAHIGRFGSQHTEAIITRDLATAREFAARVDSSAVMINASTRFNDGGCLGLGAEIGISTDKFHARGPCGLKELTTYKWVCYGNGHVRE